MNKLIGVVGPTGVGKTALAIKIAREFQGEIVSCDSRQVYRFMDIGTAKPSPEDRKVVPHHLLDIIDPDDVLSLAEYQKMTYKCINDIQVRGLLPILTGGTGQYFWAVVEGWQIPEVPPDQTLRNRLSAIAENEGVAVLYNELQILDPIAARKIDPRNVRRVIRALEVIYQTGQPFSQIGKKLKPPYDILIIGLTLKRELLYRRVDNRVDEMISNGLVDEVRKLMAMGYNESLPALSSIGYQQIIRYLKNEYSLEEAVVRIKFETHRFIRHQYAWFRLDDKRIQWYDLSGGSDEDRILKAVSDFLHYS